MPDWLFWDMSVPHIDWRNDARTVVSRILERGNDQELEEIIRFYGLKKVLRVIKKEETYYSKPARARIYTYFNLKPEELRCYYRPSWRPDDWEGWSS